MGGVVNTVALSGMGLLLLAGVTHIASISRLKVEIEGQGLLSNRICGSVAVLLPIVELGAGGAGVAAFILGDPDLFRGSLIAATLMYISFSIYSGVLIRRWGRDAVPCGCSDNALLNAGTVTRAVVLGVAGLLALTSPTVVFRPAAWIATPALTIGLMLWVFPLTVASPKIR